jgi:Fic family protein
LDGRKLPLEQTDLVINEGQTISGKSMREHLEAINHQEAIVFIKIVFRRMSFSVKRIVSLHTIILGIHR